MANKRANILDSLKLDQAFRLAKRKMADGFADEAMTICDGILTKFPQNNRAKELRKAAMAEILTPIIINSDPTLNEVRSLLANYNQGEFSKALIAVATLLAKFPQSSALYNIHGAINARLNNFDLAIESYRKAIKFKPDCAEAYNNLGDALQKKRFCVRNKKLRISSNLQT